MKQGTESYESFWEQLFNYNRRCKRATANKLTNLRALFSLKFNTIFLHLYIELFNLQNLSQWVVQFSVLKTPSPLKWSQSVNTWLVSVIPWKNPKYHYWLLRLIYLRKCHNGATMRLRYWKCDVHVLVIVDYRIKEGFLKDLSLPETI